MISRAWAIEAPGTVVGMNRIDPSSSGGMNSLPSRCHGKIVAPRRSPAAETTSHGRLSAASRNGRYSQRSARFTGLARSGRIRPRTRYPMSTGTSVIARKADPAMAKVLVNASGLNSRPSCCSSANTGRKLNVMMRREKKRGGPTCFALSRTTSQREAPGAARSRCLCMFSIMTIAASTMAPIAIAIPPRLMMLAFTPIQRMTMNERRMPSGSVTIATSADRKCSRNSSATAATMSDSSTSFSRSVSMARWIRSLRS